MINLRSSLSALALVGALVGAPSFAHATTTPGLSEYSLLLSANDSDVVSVVNTFKNATHTKYSTNVQVNDLGAIGSAPVTGGSKNFATSVDFTLGSGTTVTWAADGYDSHVSGVTYELISGNPAQASTNYNTLPVLASGDTFSLSGLTEGGHYALLIQGLSNLTTNGNYAFTGTLSAVPLPGSLVMFGSALLGLTAFGARRRSSFSA